MKYIYFYSFGQNEPKAEILMEMSQEINVILTFGHTFFISWITNPPTIISRKVNTTK
jgi:hypothetical protein